MPLRSVAHSGFFPAKSGIQSIIEKFVTSSIVGGTDRESIDRRSFSVAELKIEVTRRGESSIMQNSKRGMYPLIFRSEGIRRHSWEFKNALF